VILVGTSGWQYRDWRGAVYPADLPARLWLENYAERFATVEVNNAFYRLPERDTFAQWRSRTPAGFRIAVKMSRYLTHIKRLKDPAEPVARFWDRTQALGDRLGPVLLQLPPTLRADADLLDAALSRFPTGVRVAVEPRHASWWTAEIRSVLERRAAALSWADRRGRPVAPTWRTTDWGYLRMHEGAARPRPSYGRAALASWLDRVASGFALGREEVYVYFNNDHGGAAVRDAIAFATLARGRDLGVSRASG